MKIAKLHKLFLHSNGISTDSRSIVTDGLFFALKGENFNGNKFAKMAIDKGAGFAIIDESEYKLDDRYILVENVLDTLQKLASFHRHFLGIKIVAITGTNGKTTTKELIFSVLNEKYNVKATSGNFNNHIGVPLTLLSFTKEHEIGIVEMGANHIGEIADLCSIAKPDCGLITNIGTAHIEGFGSFDGVITAKTEMYSFLKNGNKTIFYNSGNDLLRSYVNNYTESISYGDSTSLEGKILSTDSLLEIEVAGIGNIKTQLIGGYNLENILAAICIGKFFELTNNDVRKGVENYVPGNNRSQFVETKTNSLILDAYNANPSSMNAALLNFYDIKTDKNKVLILGDMLELGKISDEKHKEVIKLIKELNIKQVYLVGKIFKSINETENFYTFESVNELACLLREKPLKNSLLLLKGSRGIQLEKLRELL